MYIFESIFDDPLCFWPFVPGATLVERCVAAKRFGMYVMLVGGTVLWSVRAVIAGFVIILLSHAAYTVDTMFTKKPDVFAVTDDETNPYANFSVGRDFETVRHQAPCVRMRNTFQSIAESPTETDVTRFVTVPRPDLAQRARF
eukprot:jgi/Mesvir1/23372/Mv21067-RA.1